MFLSSVSGWNCHFEVFATDKPSFPSRWLPLLCRFNLYVWWLKCPSNILPCSPENSTAITDNSFFIAAMGAPFAGERQNPDWSWTKEGGPEPKVSDISQTLDQQPVSPRKWIWKVAETALGPFRDSFSSFLTFWALDGFGGGTKKGSSLTKRTPRRTTSWIGMAPPTHSMSMWVSGSLLQRYL